MAEQRIGFEWGIEDAEDAEVALRIAREEGADAELDQEGSGLFPLIPVIVGAILVVKLAGMVLRFIKDIQRGGIIIDARQKPVKITHDKSLDRGKVIVINAKGETTTLADASTKEDDLADLVKNAIAGGGNGSANAAAGATTPATPNT